VGERVTAGAGGHAFLKGSGSCGLPPALSEAPKMSPMAATRSTAMVGRRCPSLVSVGGTSPKPCNKPRVKFPGDLLVWLNELGLSI